mmetsp:Transcript_21403/g.54673  ORF Transcript_21403/g.54673 Transcript_21403/m.54673 type:complete len:99 (+) Transcript_21403:746-1042(+)
MRAARASRRAASEGAGDDEDELAGTTGFLLATAASAASAASFSRRAASAWTVARSRCFAAAHIRMSGEGVTLSAHAVRKETKLRLNDSAVSRSSGQVA